MTVTNSVKVLKLHEELSLGIRARMLDDEDDPQRRTYTSDSDNGDHVKVHCDDYTLSSTLNVSSQRKRSTLVRRQHGKQSLNGTLKSAKSKGHSKKESLCKLDAACCSKMVQRRGKDDKDIDAANALVELATERPSLQVLIVEMDSDRVCYNNNNSENDDGDDDDDDDDWDYKKKAKDHVRKLQKSAGEDRGSLHFSLPKAAYPAERRCKKRKVGMGYSMPQPDFVNGDSSEEEDKLYETYGFFNGHELTVRLGDKGQQLIEACLSGGHHRLGMLLSGSNSTTKNSIKQDKLIPVLPNLKNKKLEEADVNGFLAGIASNPPLPKRKRTTVVAETKLLKKPEFTKITPATNSHGFSFSIIHLLSAVRRVMDIGNEFQSRANEGMNNCSTDKNNLPSLTIHEIVQLVKSHPGDPCILETEEPLQDLVRGVLKILSSKTAPLGAKGWKALTFYDKSSKTWSWVGPVTFNPPNHDALEEDISHEAWGIPRKMLVKLVDSYADWLKNSQETIKQVGGLPAPPISLMQPTDHLKERFVHLRNKSITTITATSEEVRAYFRIEEGLRYLVPSMAFSYTAIDGKKSMVAPLGRCSGKPSSRIRNHFMLKPDRPPHVSNLCLVRDAAARLPGGIGTRADVCILIRDSQYIAEDISDIQINQVVSGALDRLHYEADPCVRFDGGRKLWVYLHGDRQIDDFEDDSNCNVRRLKYKLKKKQRHGT